MKFRWSSQGSKIVVNHKRCLSLLRKEKYTWLHLGTDLLGYCMCSNRWYLFTIRQALRWADCRSVKLKFFKGRHGSPLIKIKELGLWSNTQCLCRNVSGICNASRFADFWEGFTCHHMSLPASSLISNNLILQQRAWNDLHLGNLYGVEGSYFCVGTEKINL